MTSMVKDLLPRKRPQLAGPSGPVRAQFSHSGLGARRARLLQRHRPDRAEPQAAPDAFRQLGDHGANWFELNKLLSIENIINIQSVGRARLFFCRGFCSVRDSVSTTPQRVGGAALQVQR